MIPEVVRTKDVEGGPVLVVSWAAGLEESVGEEYVISVVEMNYMGWIVTQLQIVEVAHFENLLAAGILEEGMIAAADIAGLVGIVID